MRRSSGGLLGCFGRFLRLNSRARYFSSSVSESLCAKGLWAVALCLALAGAVFFILSATVNYLNAGVQERRVRFAPSRRTIDGMISVHVHNANQIR